MRATLPSGALPQSINKSSSKSINGPEFDGGGTFGVKSMVWGVSCVSAGPGLPNRVTGKFCSAILCRFHRTCSNTVHVYLWYNIVRDPSNTALVAVHVILDSQE